jgi:hypothetical protein
MTQDILDAGRFNYHFNCFWYENEMIESYVNSIRTRRIDRLVLNKPPDDEEFGRRVAQALASNAHIMEITISLGLSRHGAVQGVIQWLTTSTAGETPTATLATFTNLATMKVEAYGHDMSVDDWDLIFRLLLTSTSLQELRLFLKSQDDRVMSALIQYLIAASRASLRTFGLDTTDSLSEADFASLCDGVAGSQLRKLILSGNLVNKGRVESGAESLAQAILESPLEDVVIQSSSLLCSALMHTQPVRNLDFTISDIDIDDEYTSININRK